MRKFLFAVLGIVLVLGLITLPPAPVVEAGSNGQQLYFFVPAGGTKISYLSVRGTYYDNSIKTWSKSLNPAQSGYSLTSYWWKYRVEVQWRLANGVSGACAFDVPKSMSGDWIAVDLSRNGGRTCYPSN